MEQTSPAPRYTLREEIANTAIHGIGLLLSIAGLVLLTITTSQNGDGVLMASSAVFGISLVFLYATSTAYHGIQRPAAKAMLRVLDHSAIYVLIAGSYTPFMLISLKGTWGWSMFVVIWSLALFGVIVEMTRLRERRGLALVLYVGMGWLLVVAIKPMLELVPQNGLLLLLAGGLAYTGGIGFYVWRSLPYHHAIWHVFVLAGSVLHYLAVLNYVVAPNLAT
jgi:hemolysin III